MTTKDMKISDVAILEWCDYWEAGNLAHVSDKLSSFDMREDLAQAAKAMRELYRRSQLTDWLIAHGCHVVEDAAFRPDKWVVVDVDGDIHGRGTDYYDAIEKAASRCST